MRILYAHNTNIEEVTANLTQVISMSNAFARIGHSTTLMLPVMGTVQAEEIRSKLEENWHLEDGLKIEVFRNFFRSRRLNKNVNFMKLYPRLRQSDADLVFVRSVHYLAVSLLAGKNSVYESHHQAVHGGLASYDWILRRLLIRLSKMRKTRLFVAISRRLKDWWVKQGVPSAKAYAWHDGFDTAFYSLPKSLAAAREATGLPQDRKIIVYTGNIHLNRGIEYIIQLAGRFPEVLFYIIGGPNSMIPRYLPLSRDSASQNIIFTGQLPHSRASALQTAADALLAVWSKDVPTIEYCSPLKIFEYMAAGRPILAFGYPTVREVLADGVDAYIADPDDIDSLEAALRDILTHPDKAQTIADQARKTAFERYTWVQRAKNILSALDHVPSFPCRRPRGPIRSGFSSTQPADSAPPKRASGSS